MNPRWPNICLPLPFFLFFLTMVVGGQKHQTCSGVWTVGVRFPSVDLNCVNYYTIILKNPRTEMCGGLIVRVTPISYVVFPE
jgi:hypothetical protein